MNDIENELSTPLQNLNLEEAKIETSTPSTTGKRGPTNPNNRRPKNKNSNFNLNQRNNAEQQLDYIPTAVVIKNIPFSIKRELLLDIFTHLGLPMPFALNYHLDNGVFRGLAFANFRTPEETAIVMNSFKGVELCGRKLKIEYKKASGGNDRRESREGINDRREQNGSEKREYRNDNGFAATKNEPQEASTLGHNEDINFSDGQTRAFFEQIASFYEDETRAALIYPPILDSVQRKIVHLISEKFGLYHYSVGTGDERHIRVSKTKPQPSTAVPKSKSNTNSRRGNNSKSNDQSSNERSNNINERNSSNLKPYKNSNKIYDGLSVYPIRQPTLPDLTKNFALRKHEITTEKPKTDAEAEIKTEA